VKRGFDLTTDEIFDWELEAIHEAILRQEVRILGHAFKAARDENIPPPALLAALLVGTPINKDLEDNDKARVPGINFEHRLDDGRWIRVKVSWVNNYLVITVHTI
jgi:hypothetical protein